MNRAGGIAFGLSAVLAWAVYNVGIDLAQAQSLRSVDLILLRYAPGAAIMIPVLLIFRINPMLGTSPLRVVLLIIVAGPPFAWLLNTGYVYSPLSHAVVIGPGMTMVVASTLARIVDRERIALRRKVGMAILLLGLIVMAMDRDAPMRDDDHIWLGDLCFAISGLGWGSFTWLTGHWRLHPLRATSLIAISSTALFLPPYLIFYGIPDVAGATWAQQIFYQGILGGALAVFFYTASIARLGASATIFPALVPAVAVLVAIPMTGILPNTLQLVGIVTATLGLLVSLNLFGKAAI